MPETKGRLRWLTVDEERQFLDGLMLDAEQRPNDMAMQDAWHLAMFLLDTGARHTEISSLRWELVDLERGTVNLYRNKVDNESTLRLGMVGVVAMPDPSVLLFRKNVAYRLIAALPLEARAVVQPVARIQQLVQAGIGSPARGLSQHPFSEGTLVDVAKDNQ